MRNAFSYKGFGRFYAAVSSSGFGDSVMLLVMSMWVKELTGSNAKAGLTFLFMIVPTLFAPLLGAWVDRFRRRPVVIWGNIASAAMMAPLVFVHTSRDIWIIWMVAFCYGISFIVVPAALNGLLKELLPEDALVDANAAIQTTKEGFRLFGPLLGAFLFATFGGWAVAALDAASFLLAAAIVASIALVERLPERDDAPHLEQMLAGMRWMASDRILRHTTIGLAMMLLVIGFAESTIYALLDAFHEPVTFASVIVMVQGIGAVIGGLASNKVIRRFGEPGGIAIGLAILGVGAVGGALSPSIAWVMVSAAVLGTALPLTFVAFNTMMQRRTPHRLMGRVSAAAEVLFGMPQAVSLAVGAMLVVAFSYRQIWTAMGLVTLLGGAYIVLKLRDVIRQGPVPSIEAAPAIETEQLTELA